MSQQRQETQHDGQQAGNGMGMRGVSRPQMGGGDGEQEHGEHGSHQGGGMSEEHRQHMLHQHHKRTLWAPWTVIVLGLWTIVAPFSFGYLNPEWWADPSGGRGAWFSDEQMTALRAWLMVWSDIGSGALLVIFGWRSLKPNRPVSMWVCCFVGIWLTFAPVLLWSPSAAAYVNDTMVGALVIALTVLIPGMPNMIMFMKMGPPTPPGWTYNPSSWPQRWIMIAAGFFGWLVSRYLATFQLGYLASAWDPFFGEGTRRVLNSNMSHMWPISDAGLGTVAYTFEFLMGYMGSPARWRTMPWMVAFFGVLVIPLGLTHILLVISQPVVVGQWCTFCLLAAAIMLPMIPLEVDEVVAMIQHVRQRVKAGEGFWRVFWKGGSAEGCTPDDRSPELMSLPDQPWKVFLSSLWGVSFPWTLVTATAVGVAMMFVPLALGVERPASNIYHVGGALAVCVAVICMSEPLRAGRWLNALLGLGLGVAPWLMDGVPVSAQIAGVAGGAAIIALSVPRGPKRERYGAWDRWIV